MENTHMKFGRRVALGAGVAGASNLLATVSVAQDKAGSPQSPEFLDIKAFGARGDGVTDDGPAFNAAIDHMRAQRRGLSNSKPGFRLQLHGGTYRIRSSIDMTRLRNFNVIIDGGGAVLVGATENRPVIDALSSRWLHFRDVFIFGDETHTPNVGIQLGRGNNTHLDSADGHIFENVSLNGIFSLACIYNFSAETTLFLHCTMWNKHASPEAYCLIQDGINAFGVTSAFVTQKAPVRMAQSFNENLLINCDFRRDGGGSSLWLASTSRHQFQRCYAANNSAAGCILHVGGQGHTMLEIDCHFEAPRMEHLFELTGASHAHFRGFSYADHATPPENSVFAAHASVQSVAMENARIDIATYVKRNAKLLDDPSIWSMSGSYYSSTDKEWTPPAKFSGTTTIGINQKFYGEVISP